ncbi:MAG: RNA polymerase sigma factor [Gammaproteobacteria bacterium]|nr:MAG: RNA polymerase sigma factor [Gammaproteobacteria bacterium]
MTATDEELAARVIATGEHAAFNELVRRHQSGVRNWLRHLAGDPVRGDELAQDAFVRAWDRLHEFRGDGSFRAWLMRIAYTLFLQERRSAARHRRLAEAVAQDPLMSESVVASAPDSGVTDLPRLLAMLSDDERSAMILSYAYGMSHAEISQVTGWPLGTVKSHLRRGRERLQRRLPRTEVVQ